MESPELTISATAAWAACLRASSRICDIACALYHPGDELARTIAPRITIAEIIAGELGILTPSQSEDRLAASEGSRI
jgi:hypothetical protein